MSRLNIHRAFPSRSVQPRQVEVLLPPSYDTDQEKRYPVLYMHDGQNLFNKETAYAGKTWGIQEALEELISKNMVPEVIVVGIWNDGDRRWLEYLPQRPFADNIEAAYRSVAARPEQTNGELLADRYLEFLTQELKPFIDQTYRTKPDRANTTIMGSSMGGLISLYAICEYPNLFTAAGCVSTHWPAVDGVILDYLDRFLPPPSSNHKIYFDYGTETLDALYEPYQQEIDKLMIQKGFVNGRDWGTRKFDGAEHSEQSWQERVDIPLKFILSPNQ